jgi:hypothetical protein
VGDQGRGDQGRGDPVKSTTMAAADATVSVSSSEHDEAARVPICLPYNPSLSAPPRRPARNYLPGGFLVYDGLPKQNRTVRAIIFVHMVRADKTTPLSSRTELAVRTRRLARDRRQGRRIAARRNDSGTAAEGQRPLRQRDPGTRPTISTAATPSGGTALGRPVRPTPRLKCATRGSMCS